jgi:hypothetical protein
MPARADQRKEKSKYSVSAVQCLKGIEMVITLDTPCYLHHQLLRHLHSNQGKIKGTNFREHYGNLNTCQALYDVVDTKTLFKFLNKLFCLNKYLSYKYSNMHF